VAILGCAAKVASSEQPVAREESNPSILPPEARLAPMNRSGATHYSLLIEQLGSDEWETRESAEKTLITELMPDTPDFTLLVKTNHKTSDPEIRNRTKRIIKYVTVKPYVPERIREELPEIWDRLSKDDSQERLDILYDVTGEHFSIPREWTEEELKNLKQDEPAKYIRSLMDDEKTLIIRGLLKGVSEPTKELKYAFLGATGRYYATVELPDLIPLFEDTDKDIMKQIAQVLPKLCVDPNESDEWKKSIPELTKLLEHKESNIRVWAAIALFELGAKEKITEGAIVDMKLALVTETGEYKERLEFALEELGKNKEEKK
jgi:hypothetical protein